ncbi:SDR family oxidoreductase [Amycolatopsis sp. NPDC023774]|uniref:SDR family NAD(P)-dependent oxidoreductase n=1 Tax=Amycolatopsis sp. NPDC023774 TaxID=3155015 RepID=UPI0033D78B06
MPDADPFVGGVPPCSGIGRASAEAFAHAGAKVLVVGRRADALAETAARHPAIEVHAADLAKTGAAESVVDAALRRWGRLDVLVDNAGIFTGMPLAETTAEGVERLFAVNVVAPSLLARAALKPLRESRGAIVNVSSTFGHRPPAVRPTTASKAAVESLTRSWALELAPDGVRVNAVAPGPTESEALVSAGLSPEEVDRVKAAEAELIPLGRRGHPADVAAWVVRLADPHAAWLTGQVLAVDGGLALAA